MTLEINKLADRLEARRENPLAETPMLATEGLSGDVPTKKEATQLISIIKPANNPPRVKKMVDGNAPLAAVGAEGYMDRAVVRPATLRASELQPLKVIPEVPTLQNPDAAVLFMEAYLASTQTDMQREYDRNRVVKKEQPDGRTKYVLNTDREKILAPKQDIKLKPEYPTLALVGELGDEDLKAIATRATQIKSWGEQWGTQYNLYAAAKFKSTSDKNLREAGRLPEVQEDVSEEDPTTGKTVRRPANLREFSGYMDRTKNLNPGRTPFTLIAGTLRLNVQQQLESAKRLDGTPLSDNEIQTALSNFDIELMKQAAEAFSYTDARTPKPETPLYDAIGYIYQDVMALEEAAKKRKDIITIAGMGGTKEKQKLALEKAALQDDMRKATRMALNLAVVE